MYEFPVRFFAWHLFIDDDEMALYSTKFIIQPNISKWGAREMVQHKKEENRERSMGPERKAIFARAQNDRKCVQDTK